MKITTIKKLSMGLLFISVFCVSISIVISPKTFSFSKTYINNSLLMLTIGNGGGLGGSGYGHSAAIGSNGLFTSIGSSAESFFPTCVFSSTNQVYCAGDNSSGQLGDGTTTNRSTPVKFNLPSGFMAQSIAAAGTYVVCALASDYQVYCAGDNSSGQLGDGTTTNRSTPVKFNLPSGTVMNGATVGGNASSAYFVCAHASNLQVYCAGDNSSGQLGDGTTTNRSTPVKFNLPSGVWAEKATAGPDSVTCVLTSSNQVYCAGKNDYGQLGDGTTTNRSTPVKFNLPSGVLVQNIIVGPARHVCVLASDNNIYCAGGNGNGRLGDGTTTNRSTPVKFNLPSGLTAQSASVSFLSTCAHASNLQVYCAGDNSSGQLGDGTTTNRSTPVKFNLPSGLTAQSVAAGYFSTCVLASDNQVYCAGGNGNGRLGDGTTTNRSTPVKFNLSSGLTAQSVVTSQGVTCVLSSNNQVYCAGQNDIGQLGIGSTISPQATPVRFQLP